RRASGPVFGVGGKPPSVQCPLRFFTSSSSRRGSRVPDSGRIETRIACSEPSKTSGLLALSLRRPGSGRGYARRCPLSIPGAGRVERGLFLLSYTSDEGWGVSPLLSAFSSNAVVSLPDSVRVGWR